VLALVISFPVMLMTFLLDFFPFVGKIAPFLDGEVSGLVFFKSFLDMLYFGGGVIVMQGYLMTEYFSDYRSIFSVKPGGAPAGWSAVLESRAFKTTLRWLSYTVGATSTLWILGMASGLIKWSSLALLAPPH
jgi:hypothetical protein